MTPPLNRSIARGLRLLRCLNPRASRMILRHRKKRMKTSPRPALATPAIEAPKSVVHAAPAKSRSMRVTSATMALMLGQVLAAPLAQVQRTAGRGAVPTPAHRISRRSKRCPSKDHVCNATIPGRTR